MIQDNELITLLLAIGVTIFLLVNNAALKKLPELLLIRAAFGVLLAGYVLTILEGFFWGKALNLIEHYSYTLSAVLLATWCYRVFIRPGWKE